MPVVARQLQLRCWVVGNRTMHLQTALQSLGLILERACGIARSPTADKRTRTLEALRESRPDLLWATLFRPPTHEPLRKSRRVAQFVAVLIEAQAELQGLYLVESSVNSRAWALEPMEKLRSKLEIRPQHVRWCCFGVRTSSGAPTGM